jgi:hypothetical protein
MPRAPSSPRPPAIRQTAGKWNSQNSPPPWIRELDDIHLAFDGCDYAHITPVGTTFDVERTIEAGARQAEGRTLEALRTENLPLETEFHHADDLAGATDMAAQMEAIRREHPEADHVDLMIALSSDGILRLTDEARVYDAEGGFVDTGALGAPRAWTHNFVTAQDLWCDTGVYPYSSGVRAEGSRAITLDIEGAIAQAADMARRDQTNG